jgi:hypothetical protein
LCYVTKLQIQVGAVGLKVIHFANKTAGIPVRLEGKWVETHFENPEGAFMGVTLRKELCIQHRCLYITYSNVSFILTSKRHFVAAVLLEYSHVAFGLNFQ